MIKEELKPIDTSKYKITETGQVLKMTKDEMKDRISMALKDPILQQGFEIICKENAELKDKLEVLIAVGNTCTKGLNKQLTKAKEILRKFLDAKSIEETCVAESEADKFLMEMVMKNNKANEWHYMKDGIMPEENQWVLVYDGSYTVCNYHSNTPIKWLDNYENEVYEGSIIAWKEIVTPKESV